MKKVKLPIEKMKKFRWFIIGGVCLILLIAIYTLWSGRTAQASAQASQQRTAIVQKGALEITLSGSGPVEAKQRKELLTQVEGTVRVNNLVEGKSVKAGDVLVELISTDAEINLKKMGNTLRQKELSANHQSEQLNNLSATASISGKIEGLTLKEGDIVNKDQVICSIVNESALQVRALFKGAQSGQFKGISEVKVHIPDYATTLTGKIDTLFPSGLDTEILINLKNPGALTSDISVIAEVDTANGSFTSESSVLEYSERVVIKAAASGTVENLTVVDKQTVSKGKSLFYIDNDDLPASVEGTLLDLEKAHIDYEQAKANMEKFTIKAPFDGVLVSTADLTPGDTLKAGTTLAVLLDTSEMEVQVSIDELDISKVKAEQDVILTVEALEDTATKPITGEVKTVAVEGISNNGVSVYPVTITLPGREDLKVGMNIDATIQVLNKENVLLVPIEAVQKRGNGYFVWVKGGTGAQQAEVSQSQVTPPALGESGDRGPLDNLSEAERQKFQNMTDEERQAMREQFQKQGGFQEQGSDQAEGQGSNRTGAKTKQGNSSISGNTYYAGAAQVRITVGDYNENYMEIVDGLNEGDTVVLPQITASTTSTSTTSQSQKGQQNFTMPGMNVGGGGFPGGGMR